MITALFFLQRKGSLLWGYRSGLWLGRTPVTHLPSPSSLSWMPIHLKPRCLKSWDLFWDSSHPQSSLPWLFLTVPWFLFCPVPVYLPVCCRWQRAVPTGSTAPCTSLCGVHASTEPADTGFKYTGQKQAVFASWFAGLCFHFDIESVFQRCIVLCSIIYLVTFKLSFVDNELNIHFLPQNTSLNQLLSSCLH